MSGAGVQGDTNLVVALKKAENLQAELIEMEQVIRVALLDNLSQDVETMLQTLIYCFIPNLVAEIDKLLGISNNFQNPKISEDGEQIGTYNLPDKAVIFKLEPCDEIVDDAGDGEEHFQVFQIIPDCDLDQGPSKSQKRRRPKKSNPKLPKTLSVSIKRLSEQELGKYSIRTIKCRPGPLSQKRKLIISNLNSKTQNVKPKTEVKQEAEVDYQDEYLNSEGELDQSKFSESEEEFPKPQVKKRKTLKIKTEPKKKQQRGHTIISESDDDYESEQVPDFDSDEDYIDPDTLRKRREQEKSKQKIRKIKPPKEPKIKVKGAPKPRRPKSYSAEDIAEIKEHNEVIKKQKEAVGSLKGPIYSCTHCSKSYPRRARLRRHLDHHLKWMELNCPKCPGIYRHESALRGHIRLKHREIYKELYPQEPPKSYSEDHGFAEEQFTNPDDPKLPFKCPVCGKPFSIRSYALRHIETHSAEKRHLCSECGQSFRTSGAFRYHVSLHHPLEVDTFSCPNSTCSKTFSAAIKLRYHLRTAHQGLQGREFKSKEEFLESVGHQKFARGRAPVEKKLLECEVCHRRFNLRRNLEDHKWRHNPELLTFVCDFPGCGKKFGAKRLLTKHLNVHSDVRKFVCKECGATFKFQSALTGHKKKMHSKGPQELVFACKSCPQRFPTQFHLTNHLNTEHFGRGHECDRCYRIFMDEDEYLVHRELEHNLTREKEAINKVEKVVVRKAPVTSLSQNASWTVPIGGGGQFYNFY